MQTRPASATSGQPPASVIGRHSGTSLYSGVNRPLQGGGNTEMTFEEQTSARREFVPRKGPPQGRLATPLTTKTQKEAAWRHDGSGPSTLAGMSERSRSPPPPTSYVRYRPQPEGPPAPGTRHRPSSPETSPSRAPGAEARARARAQARGRNAEFLHATSREAGVAGSAAPRRAVGRGSSAPRARPRTALATREAEMAGRSGNSASSSGRGGRPLSARELQFRRESSDYSESFCSTESVKAQSRNINGNNSYVTYLPPNGTTKPVKGVEAVWPPSAGLEGVGGDISLSTSMGRYRQLPQHTRMWT
jgi:hypothetical protein